LDIVSRGPRRIASRNEQGINAGKYSINMAGYSRIDNKAVSDRATTKRFEKYEGENGYAFLDGILSSAK
jgi:hypothetical protein